jgi:putative endonuclease
VKAARNRVKAQRSGLSAERWACWLLRLKGYRILAVNWRCPAGEVDILARRGAVLAAIEVKRRAESESSAGDAADATALLAISPKQQARVARAAEAFAARREDCRNMTLRLDAITVVPGVLWPRLRHYPAAWQGDSL